MSGVVLLMPSNAVLSPVILTFQINTLGAVSTNTYTFGTLTLGAAPSANRRVIVSFEAGDFSTGSGYTISSVVFTPDAGGTVSADTIVNIGSNTQDGILLVSAVLPVGTTSTLVVTLSNTAFTAPRFAFYTVDNSILVSPLAPVTGYGTNTSGTTLTANVNTLAGGAVLALFSGNASPGSFTAGIGASDGSFGNNLFGHANNVAASTPFNVTDTWTGTNNPAGLGLVAYR